MPKQDLFDTHHKQRKLDKKKRHQRGFTEDFKEQRASRVSFKKYMQQISEQEILDDIEEEDDE